MGMIGGPVCPKNVCPIYKHHRFEKLPLKRSVLIHHKLTELTGKIHTTEFSNIYPSVMKIEMIVENKSEARRV